MLLELYTKLQTKSRRAIRKQYGRFGHPYRYNPRSDLIDRLSEEAGMTRTEVYNKLMAEREFLLKHQNLG